MKHAPSTSTHTHHGLLAAFALVFAIGLSPVPQAQADGLGDGQVQLAQRAKRGKGKRRRSARRRAETEAKQAEAEAATSENGEEENGEAAANNAETDGKPQPSAGSLRRSNRMEFDARLIRGQTAGSGAVVLFDRSQRELPPLTKARTRFLDTTVREVYGDTPGATDR